MFPCGLQLRLESVSAIDQHALPEIHTKLKENSVKNIKLSKKKNKKKMKTYFLTSKFLFLGLW